MKKVFVVAGEASGDLHGANLARALKQMDPTLEIYGAGGQHLRSEVTGGFVETAHLNVTGITEVLRYIPDYLRLFRVIQDKIVETRPDLIVLIDNPGFNLRLAERLQALRIPIVYYICPQIWAWGEKRVHVMKRCLRKALVVFDFEREVYHKHGMMNVGFVGHPMKDVLKRELAAPHVGKPSGETRILLMPGSRTHEVKNLLPILIKAAEKIARRIPGAAFYLIKAPTIPGNFYAEILGGTELRIRVVEDKKHAIMRDADLSLVCSGTATLECALLNVPMVVLYRASFITYLAAKAMVKVKHLAIPNLLLGETIVPELLQYDCHASNIALAAFDILEKPEKKAEMKRRLALADEKLGSEGASVRAAAEILKELSA